MLDKDGSTPAKKDVSATTPTASDIQSSLGTPGDLSRRGLQRELMGGLGQPYPVGWDGMQRDLYEGRDKGFALVFVVADYTSDGFWDNFLFDVLPAVGLQPDAREANGKLIPSTIDALKSLPRGNFNTYHLMEPQCSESLYGKAGIVKPGFSKLPAIFICRVGEDTGKYLFNVDNDKAVDFLKQELFRDN